MIIVDRQPLDILPGRTVSQPFPISDAALSLTVETFVVDHPATPGRLRVALEISNDGGASWYFLADYTTNTNEDHSFMRAGLRPVLGSDYKYPPLVVASFDQPSRLGRIAIQSDAAVSCFLSVSNSIGLGTPNTVYGNATSVSVAVDAGSGSDRFLLSYVYSAIGNFPLYDSYTYNSLNLTLAESAARYLVGYYIAPATGSHTLTIDLLLTGNAEINLYGIPMDGVNQATPFGTIVEASGSGSPMSSAVTTSSGGVAVDFMRVSHTAGGGSLTKDASQTNLVAGNSPDGGANSYGSSYKADATSMDWTAAVAGNWVHYIVPVVAAAAAGNPHYYYRNQKLTMGA